MSFEVIPTKIITQVRNALQISISSNWRPRVSHGNLYFNHASLVNLEFKNGAKLLSKWSKLKKGINVLDVTFIGAKLFARSKLSQLSSFNIEFDIIWDVSFEGYVFGQNNIKPQLNNP